MEKITLRVVDGRIYHKGEQVVIVRVNDYMKAIQDAFRLGVKAS